MRRCEATCCAWHRTSWTCELVPSELEPEPMSWHSIVEYHHWTIDGISASKYHQQLPNINLKIDDGSARYRFSPSAVPFFERVSARACSVAVAGSRVDLIAVHWITVNTPLQRRITNKPRSSSIYIVAMLETSGLEKPFYSQRVCWCYVTCANMFVTTRIESWKPNISWTHQNHQQLISTDINWLLFTETTAAKRVVCALLFLGHFSGQSRGRFGRPGRLCERVSWWLSRLFAPPAQGAFDYYKDYDLHWNHWTQCKKTVQTNNTLPACCTVFNRIQ